MLLLLSLSSCYNKRHHHHHQLGDIIQRNQEDLTTKLMSSPEAGKYFLSWEWRLKFSSFPQGGKCLIQRKTKCFSFNATWWAHVSSRLENTLAWKWRFFFFQNGLLAATHHHVLQPSPLVLEATASRFSLLADVGPCSAPGLPHLL